MAKNVVKLDCYAVLGLSPAAEDAVIRAAYLALMRSYHPDRNGTPEAAARVRTITEAYKTIGDPARRAEYDARRTAHMYEILGYDEEVEPPRRQWRKGPVAGVAASALAIVLAIMVLPLTRGGQADTAPPRTANGGPAPPGATETKQPAQPAAPKPSSLAETGQSPALALTATSGKALPPPPEPVRAIARPDPVRADMPARPKRIAEAPKPADRKAAAPKPTPADEREKARVATLEWQSTSFYNQSVNHADGSKKLELQQARDLFVAARNACKSDKCVGDAHVSYIRDIASIVQKRKAD